MVGLSVGPLGTGTREGVSGSLGRHLAPDRREAPTRHVPCPSLLRGVARAPLPYFRLTCCRYVIGSGRRCPLLRTCPRCPPRLACRGYVARGPFTPDKSLASQDLTRPRPWPGTATIRKRGRGGGNELVHTYMLKLCKGSRNFVLLVCQVTFGDSNVSWSWNQHAEASVSVVGGSRTATTVEEAVP